ncbi:MAG: hypothetical protein ACFFA3_15815 [Promethearchaeota archaeon]
MDDNLENDLETGKKKCVEREIGENYRINEILREIFKKEKKVEILKISERKKKEIAYRREFKINKLKLNEPNYLNSHPYWDQPFSPLPLLFRVIEWIFQKRVLRSVE